MSQAKKKGGKRVNHIRGNGGIRASGQGEQKGENSGASAQSGVGPLEPSRGEGKEAIAKLEVAKGDSEPEADQGVVAIKYNKHLVCELYQEKSTKLSESQIREELRLRAVAVLQTSKELSNRYWRLCQWIVEQQITPEILTQDLRDLGFRKERISEIKKVCFTSPQIYDDYKRRAIGWKVALEKSRVNRSEQEAIYTRWLEFFRLFEKLFSRCQPPRSLHQGNGFNLLMWRDADCNTDNGIVDDNGRWHIVITRRK